MPPTAGRPAKGGVSRPRFGSVGAEAWSHRWGALSWVVGTGAFLTYFGFGYQASVRSFKGGAPSFGLAASAVADAMRPISGPAQRLDTYGGYVTYHNASYVVLLLSLWAVIQGARAIRGWEERGGIELWLATGRRRWMVVRDQWVGFLIPLAVIAAGVAIGYGAGAAVAQDANWGGAIAVAVETALVAATFFGLGMLVSQLTGTSRAGAGLTTIGMVGLYLLANMAPDLGWFAWLRFLSPFFYFQQSRALVPGHSVDIVSTTLLVLTATTAVVISAALFERRDLGSRLWQSRAKVEAVTRRVRIRAPWLRDAWIADLRLEWVSIALWALASGAFMVMMVAVARNVSSVWEQSELIRQLFARIPGTTFVDQYMSYMTILAALAPVAFVVAEASRWVGDLNEGRTEAQLSVFGSRSRVVLEWAASATAGIIVVTLAVIAGSIVGGAVAGVDLRADSLVRTAAAAILLGSAICGVALLAVVVFRSGVAVGGLGGLLGLGFFVSILAPLFNWPEWVARLSPFDAFGTPYVSVPRPSGLALLACLAVVGTGAALLVARQRSALSS